MGVNRGIEPRLNSFDRLKIGSSRSKPLNFANAPCKEIRIDQPNRLSESLDLGVEKRTAFARAVRAGDNEEERAIRLLVVGQNQSGR